MNRLTPFMSPDILPSMSFNPRRPHGRRLVWITMLAIADKFQSAPPSRAATAATWLEEQARAVSIRAALTGGDFQALHWRHDRRCFNPRRPHGRRQVVPLSGVSLGLFQSAPPSRAATFTGSNKTTAPHVSIRAALTGGDVLGRLPRRRSAVSIRAALTGGDALRPTITPLGSSFNPRRPHGRRHLLPRKS